MVANDAAGTRVEEAEQHETCLNVHGSIGILCCETMRILVNVGLSSRV